ncbi:hypothetical protein Leryth_004496 [Lithospermum erythrorhizon]|nr:hypothetical protein Leryth_004496 [Lithospermum erythrorhizon]
MAKVSSFSGAALMEKPLQFQTLSWLPPRMMKLSRKLKQVDLHGSRREISGSCIRMAVVDERFARGSVLVKPPSEILAFELVQGKDATWSYIMDKSAPEPPTAVLLHGILGSRKNWGTFARRLAQEFPKWQVRLLDKYFFHPHSSGSFLEFFFLDQYVTEVLHSLFSSGHMPFQMSM